MATTSPHGEINPQHTYSIEAAARALGRSTRWVQDNIVRNDKCLIHKQGDYIGIPGWCLQKAIESDLRPYSEWQATNTEKPKSRSKSKPSS